MAKRFEYALTKIMDGSTSAEVLKLLNRYGAEGWEVVGLQWGEPGSDLHMATIIFKRENPNGGP